MYDKYESNETPSKFWYILHIFFGILTGIACFLLWKDRNPQAARKHLIHSIWIPLVALILPMLVIMPFWIE